MDTILSFILRNLRSSQGKQPTGHTVWKAILKELGMSIEQSQTSYHSMQQNDSYLSLMSQKQLARKAFKDQLKIDPKLDWLDFWHKWKNKTLEQRALKAKLQYKHSDKTPPTPDTVEERCLLWQREAFRRS